MSLHWWLGWLVSCPAGSLAIGLRARGRRNLGRGACIIASNHLTNVDPLVLAWAAARELNFLAKAELFGASRFFSWLIRGFHAWPVRRGGADRSALAVCARILRSGGKLVLFPEGTRSRTGELASFKPGIGMLAQMNHVPVVPVHLGGLPTSTVSWLVDKDFVARGYRSK
ncbi:MAG: lysophospholipid acyltransferase family protein, partial [bacterium]